LLKLGTVDFETGRSQSESDEVEGKV
jgi:hypothetical protein